MTRAGGQSETDLLRRAEAGDEDAFHSLYQQFQGPVYRFALHMAGSVAVAEDVTQEVFMILIEKKSRFDASRGTLRSYLFGTARHLLLRHFEGDRKFVPLAGPGCTYSPAERDAQLPGESGTNGYALPSVPPVDFARSEGIERMRQAVLSLPAEYRETVVLCELQEFSYEQAAEALECPVGTIRSRLHRARALLAEKLGSGLYLQPGQKEVRVSRAARPEKNLGTGGDA